MFSLPRKNSLQFRLYGIIALISIIIPLYIGQNLSLLTLVLAYIYCLICLINKKYYINLVIIAISACIPLGYGSGDIKIPIFENMQLWQARFIQWILMFFGVYSLLTIKSIDINRKNMKILLLCLILCTLVGFVNTNNKQEIYFSLGIIGVVVGMFFVSYRCNISFKNYFKVIDFIFYLIVCYAFFEFILRLCPYNQYYNLLIGTNAEFFGRAKGLLGHPLLLSGVVLLYQAVLFVKTFYKLKINIVNQILCIVCALITVSRTTLVVLSIEFILYLIFTQSYKSVKKFIIYLLCLIIILFGVIEFGEQYLTDLFIRIEEGNIDHRLAGWKTTYNLLSENYFGVGHTDIMDAIRKGGYATYGFATGFTTIDNVFLGELCSYGILGILTILFYYQYLIFAFKKRKTTPVKYKSILFLYIVMTLLGLSYNWNGIGVVSLMFYSIVGYLMRTSE